MWVCEWWFKFFVSLWNKSRGHTFAYIYLYIYEHECAYILLNEYFVCVFLSVYEFWFYWKMCCLTLVCRIYTYIAGYELANWFHYLQIFAALDAVGCECSSRWNCCSSWLRIWCCEDEEATASTACSSSWWFRGFMEWVAANGSSVDVDDVNDFAVAVATAVATMDATDAANAAALSNHAICVNDKLGRLDAAAADVTKFERLGEREQGKYIYTYIWIIVYTKVEYANTYAEWLWDNLGWAESGWYSWLHTPHYGLIVSNRAWFTHLVQIFLRNCTFPPQCVECNENNKWNFGSSGLISSFLYVLACHVHKHDSREWKCSEVYALSIFWIGKWKWSKIARIWTIRHFKLQHKSLNDICHTLT